jgi:hypothetical protein
MYFQDHAPPHFHAFYGGDEALIDIQTLVVLRGLMRQRALNLVLEWAQAHQNELMQDWTLCQNSQPPNKIAPLP